MRYQNFINQNGNIAFYVAVVIPVALTLCIIAIDVTAYQLKRVKLQKTVDELVVGGAQFLPNTEASKLYIYKQLSRYKEFQIAPNKPQGNLLFEVTPSSISLTLHSYYNSSFTGFLPNSEDYRLEYQQHAAARLAPVDTMIVMADSNAFRPHSQTTWGDPQQWPASKYFNFVEAPLINSEEPILVNLSKRDWIPRAEDWETDLYRRWVTQSCYNPVWSSFKLAIIGLTDVWGEARDNRVGVISTPGENGSRGYTVITGLASQNSENPQIQFGNYFESKNLLSDELCMLIGARHISDETRYSIPERRFQYSNQHTKSCIDSVDTSKVWGQLHFPYRKFDTNCLKTNMSLREALYYHSVRANAHFNNSENVKAALEASYSELLNYQLINSADIANLRRQLASYATRRIILISDNLPPLDFVYNFVERLEGEPKVELIIVPIKHSGLSSSQIETLENRAEAFRRYQFQSPSLIVLPMMSPESFLEKGTSLLVGLKRQVVLSR